MLESIVIIPEKVKIGFKEIDNNEKLSILTYLRPNNTYLKDKSWNNFINKKFGNKELNNIPISGFSIEGYIYGYIYCGSKIYSSYNQDFVRLRDPRGFLFDISNKNFIEILNYCDCVDKKLCGQFVYSWDNYEDLILLPVSSESYLKSIKFKKGSKIFSGNDLKPGCRYVFKEGKLPYKFKNSTDPEKNYSSNYDEVYDSGIFIGAVKFPTDYKKNYTTVYLFYCKEPILEDNSDGKDFVYIMNPKDVDYVLNENYLSDKEVKNILEKFNNTAFSWNFWNRNSGNIETIDIIQKESESFLTSCLSFINSSNSFDVALSSSPKNNNEFYYLKKYFEYTKLKNNYYYERVDNLYIASKFFIDNGTLKIDEYINLGKQYSGFGLGNCTKSIIRSNSPIKIDSTYPNADNKNIEKARNSKLPKGVVGNILYKMNNGQYSDSLGIMLSIMRNTSFDEILKIIKNYSIRMYLPFDL